MRTRPRVSCRVTPRHGTCAGYKMGQSRDLLIGIGSEIDDGFCAEGMVFLPPRHQRLLEPAADALAAEEPEMPGPGG